MPQGDKLKDCPFCGSFATVTDCSIETYDIEDAGEEYPHEIGCQHCGIVIVAWTDDEIDGAIDTWNQRAPNDKGHGRVPRKDG